MFFQSKQIIPTLACSILFLQCIAGPKKGSDSGNVSLKKIPAKMNQGVAVGEKYYYAISNTSIIKFDKKMTNR